MTRISYVRTYHVAYPLDRPLSDSSPDLRVHDTPWLYVFSGAVFPTCPGVNPTLTMWAVCYRAAERLVERLSRGEEQLLDRR